MYYGMEGVLLNYINWSVWLLNKYMYESLYTCTVTHEQGGGHSRVSEDEYIYFPNSHFSGKVRATFSQKKKEKLLLKFVVMEYCCKLVIAFITNWFKKLEEEVGIGIREINCPSYRKHCLTLSALTTYTHFLPSFQTNNQSPISQYNLYMSTYT